MDRVAQEDPGETAVRLTGRQRALYERLTRQRNELGAMYLGAQAALASRNPDAVAQAAHSARELMTHLLRGFHQSTGKQGDAVAVVVNAWEEFDPGDDRDLEQMDDQALEAARRVLPRVRHLVRWMRTNRPRARDQANSMLAQLDASGMALPEHLTRESARQWMELQSYFNQVAHHSATAPEALGSRLASLEDLLAAKLVPETFSDFAAIDEILGGTDESV